MGIRKHARDDRGVCWTTQIVKGEIAWTLCGRSSYEAVVRCDEHSPLQVETLYGFTVVIDPEMPENEIEMRTETERRRLRL